MKNVNPRLNARGFTVLVAIVVGGYLLAHHLHTKELQQETDAERNALGQMLLNEVQQREIQAAYQQDREIRSQEFERGWNEELRREAQEQGAGYQVVTPNGSQDIYIQPLGHP
jgi:hypothetical protein